MVADASLATPHSCSLLPTHITHTEDEEDLSSSPLSLSGVSAT